MIFLHLKIDFQLDVAEAADILGIFPYLHTAGPLFVRPLVRVLVERGHKVTVISPEHTPTDIEGVRHIRVPELNRQIRKIMDPDHYFHFFSTKWKKSILAATMLANVSTALLADEGVRKMMKDRSERFDMVMIEASHLEAMYGLAEYYNATLMGIASMRLNWHVDELAGNPSPSIHESISLEGPPLKYSLLGRFYNWLDITEEYLLERLVIRPSQLKIFKWFFGYSAEKLEELRSRFNLILINTHFSMGRVRANVPNIIEVGGMHLSDPPEPCDEELQRFLDEAEHGVIYFSMGLEIRFKYLPDYMQQPLLQSFAELKQRVVWKNELFTSPNKTDNVFRIGKAPQRIILSHPNTRLFITHGGLLSVIEAIDSGVPMLGLPLFFDQFNNMQRVESAGVAKVLDWNSLSVDNLISTVHEIIEDPKYAQKARETAQNFRDRPMNPLDTAVWWTEYALRHRNATHIRLNKGELPFMVYYQLDNLLPLILRIGVILVSIIFFSYKLFEKLQIRQRRLQERNLFLRQQIMLR
ncbi:uncharacterized protein Dana_GF18759 [Drosophila ananassae]|uniref:Uncharacterized protein n=3 Tax=Drosophila ananassae TaxID=7217 RepID=B3LY85_DROAN|nr:uncharacterized protein Dana_GF18759 [Drosophila ananassae]